MAIYLIQFVVILAMGLYLKPERKESSRKAFCLLSFALLWFFSAFRGNNIGADTPVYINLYRNINLYSVINVRYEPGFMLYMKALRAVSSDPTLLLSTSSAIIIGTMCWLTYRASKRPIISILLYLTLGGYHGQMNTMRQSIAVSLTVLAFLLLLSGTGRYKIYSALLLAVATSFQYVAVVCYIPYIILIRENANRITGMNMRQRLFQTTLYALIAFAAYAFIMQMAIQLFPSYAHYLTSSRWSDSNYSASLFKTLIQFVFLLVGAFVFRNKKLDGFQNFLSIMIGFAVLFHVLSMRMEIWGRVSSMFSVYTTIVFSAEIVDEVKDGKTRSTVMYAMLFASLAYMIITLHFRPEWLKVVPYAFRW